jgi:LacI family transcriptional regulator
MDHQLAVFAPFHGVGEKVLIGIANYCKKYPGWSIRPFSSERPVDQDVLGAESYAAAIIVDFGEREVPTAFGEGIPCVRVYDRGIGPSDACVTVDQSEVGLLAAQHLQGRGFRHFAFVGCLRKPDASARYEAFRDYLSGSGFPIHVFPDPVPGVFHAAAGATGNRDSFRARLARWMDAIPGPVGVFAYDDWCAFEVQQACRAAGISIPDRVALIGVNDDDLACQIASPCLSSVRLPLERMGMEAARLAVELAQGRQVESLQFKPVGLVARDSTHGFAVKDALVKQALEFMLAESRRPINVGEVLSYLGVSRSLLERRFREAIGRTPLVELRRQRVERARALLADTDLAIHRIGDLCGFSSNIRFTTVFREQVGVTPSEFRLQMQ